MRGLREASSGAQPMDAALAMIHTQGLPRRDADVPAVSRCKDVDAWHPERSEEARQFPMVQHLGTTAEILRSAQDDTFRTDRWNRAKSINKEGNIYGTNCSEGARQDGTRDIYVAIGE